jgi:hypothetical protein
MKQSALSYLFAAAAVVAIGGSASAATVTLTPTSGITNPDYLLDFDNTNLVKSGSYGVSAEGDYAIQHTSISIAAEPLGDTSRYIAVPFANSNGSATLSFDFGANTVQALSFQWGSIDSYNSIDLLNAAGATFQTISGSSYPPADGNQTSPSSTGFFNIDLAAGETLGGIRLNSSQYALEADNFGFKFTSAAPEPSTWALMIAGVGLIGLTFRRAQKAMNLRLRDMIAG